MKNNKMEIFTEPVASWFTETFGEATKVQQEAWPAIASGSHVLLSAPTGTGKTLSAFLVFIDRLQDMAARGELKEELYLLYVSPLKSLAGDIRENLKKPLTGIALMKGGQGAASVKVAIRTGDTPQRDRQRMVKHPPHILITTPESLYLMLTSQSGRSVLHTAKALIIDELHALIDTKRGAHLMLSAARLDWLCQKPLQRIGLSATIEPLELAAQYLSPDPVMIAAPAMHKEVRIEVNGITPSAGRRKDPVWEELARKVYDRCQQCRSVLAFSEARRYAEKLAYYVNQLGGDDFARVHHGSMSKEQRAEAEEALRSGKLRLLCATSSMELGIDVGEIDQVLQVGCPRTISGMMQRLGRAGHNPGRVSVMYMYPRTAPETLYCGMTAQIARQGGVEHARPPRMCLDILAQHLVSMAANADVSETSKVSGKQKTSESLTAYTLDDVMKILARTYSFRDVTREDVKDVLGMLAGDYEHKREIPVRPRILYDRIHERVYADAYSRMLAVAAGGTIPDKGMYTAKTEDGVKVGELDEEFVYESYRGDRFLLGAFAWKIVGQDKNNVIVTQANVEGARLPFWKGETKGRDLATSLSFGKIMHKLFDAEEQGCLLEALEKLGLDEAARENTAEFLRRQIQADGILPDDRTIVIEHFTDSTGSHQAMIHTLFGRRVNKPLSLLLQYAAQERIESNVGCVDDEDGILLYSYGEDSGRVRRGYFVRGLSGAQFIRKQDYEGISQALARPEERIIWLNAADTAQLWGKVLEHLPGRSFQNVPGTAVTLLAGMPVMLLERQGKILRLLEKTDMETALMEFAAAFREKLIIVVGKYVGDNALAAVGSAGPILNLLLVLFIGISVGSSVMVSQYFGAKQREELSSTIGSCIILTAIASVAIMFLAPFVIRPALELLHTPDTIIDWCASYLRILFIGIAGVAYYNILSGILRGLGDSVSALLYLLVATVLNIILDIWFVAGLKMGVAGVALATAIAQAVSAILCLWKLSRMRNTFDLRWKYLKMDKVHAVNIVRLGLPSGVTQAIFSLAMVIVQSLTNSFGEMFIAANVIVMRVDGFAMMPNFSFGTTMTTYAGQNVGARDYHRVQQGAKQGTFIAAGTSAVITLLILLFGKGLMGIFTNTGELVELSMRLMCILAAGYIAMAVTQSLSGVMRGAGDTMTPMWISLITTVCIRVPLAYGISWLTITPELPHGRSECIFVSLLVSWVLGAVITVLFYKRGKWKTKALGTAGREEAHEGQYE